ncbi:MAG: hypothetical protein FWF54_03690 [Candidatus Azobacteroides sp.]|nr:hypothetical protein [Candidatus Azobacteroides sp.]
MENNYDLNGPKIDLPNATIVLVLGIVSIVGNCFCFGFIGLICGIIALVLAKSAKNLYISNPDQYTENSFKNVNTGKICAWIGVSLAILVLIVVGILGVLGAFFEAVMPLVDGFISWF